MAKPMRSAVWLPSPASLRKAKGSNTKTRRDCGRPPPGFSAYKSSVFSDEDELHTCFFSIQVAFWIELREMYNNIFHVVFFSLEESMNELEFYWRALLKECFL